MDDKIKKRKDFIVNLIFIIILVALFYCGIKFTIQWLMPFVIGFIIAIVIDPLIRFFNRKFHIKRNITSIILVILIWVILGFIVYKVGQLLFEQSKNLLSYIGSMSPDNIIKQINDWFNSTFPSMADKISDNTSSKIIEQLTTGFISYAKSLLQSLTSFLMQIPSVAVFIIFSILSSIFISIDLPFLKYFFSLQIPNKGQTDVLEARMFIKNKIFKFIRAYAIILTITFTELLICFSIIGVNYALVIAIVVALVDLLPIIGTSMMLIPWAIVELILGDVKLCVGLLITTVIVFVVRQIIEPRIVSGQVGLHPLLTLICIFVGLKIFGVIGMIILPLCALCIKELNDTGRIHLWKIPEKVIPEDISSQNRQKK